MELSAGAIWLATAAVDMRTGIDGLSLHVQQALGRPPCNDVVESESVTFATVNVSIHLFRVGKVEIL